MANSSVSRASRKAPFYGLLKQEADSRRILDMEWWLVLCRAISLTRLQVTEACCRSRLTQIARKSLRHHSKKFLQCTLEHSGRQILLNMECIEWLELCERCAVIVWEWRERTLIRSTVRQCDILQLITKALHEEKSQREALQNASMSTLSLLAHLCHEHPIRNSLMRAECTFFELLQNMCLLGRKEILHRRQIEAREWAAQPNFDLWAIEMEDLRQRHWLLLSQKLQRQEMTARFKLMTQKWPMVARARAGCVRILVQHCIETLKKRESKRRKTIASSETISRVLLGAKRTIQIAAESRRVRILVAERKAWCWIEYLSGCILQEFLQKHRIGEEEAACRAKLVHQRDIVLLCWRCEELQIIEARERAAMTLQYQTQWKLMTGSVTLVYRQETAGRAYILRQCNTFFTFASLEHKELGWRSHQLHTASLALQSLLARCQKEKEIWFEAEWFRTRIETEWGRRTLELRIQKCVEYQIVCRCKLQHMLLTLLDLIYAQCRLEIEEILQRRPLQAEQVHAFAVLQHWGNVTGALELKLSSARRTLVEMEALERQEIQALAAINQKMARVSTDVRIAQQSRAKETLGAKALRSFRRPRARGILDEFQEIASQKLVRLATDEDVSLSSRHGRSPLVSPRPHATSDL